MRLPTLRGRLHGPLPLGVIAAVLLVGAGLLFAAIVIRRRFSSTAGTIAANVVLLLAALWNGGIVFAFMSPHNRHVFHLATHHASVVVNAAIGVVWLVACLFAIAKWWRAA
jgi:hypothetical protein